jgi:hypothetical protein
LGLLLPMAVLYLLAGYYSLPEIAAYLLIGSVVGLAFAGGRWLLEVLLGGIGWRVVGGGLGFCLGLLLLAPFTPNLTGWQLAGGWLCGAAVALGCDLLADPQARNRGGRWRAGLGGGIGGALSFAATALTALRLPFVAKPVLLEAFVHGARVSAAVVIAAALAGALTGAGLAAGGAAGEALWRRLSEGSGVGDRDSAAGGL